MRKLTPVVPAILILGLCALLFVFMCMPRNPQESYRALSFDTHFLRTRGIYLFAVGGVMFTALNNLVFYIFRRRDKGYLYFALLCAAYALQTVFIRNGLNDTFKWVTDAALLARLGSVLFFLLHNNIAWVGLHNLRPDLLSAHKRKLLAYLLIGMIYCAVSPIPQPFSDYVLYGVSFIVSISTMAAFVKSRALKESHWVRLYFVPYILIIMTSLFWLLIDRGAYLMPGFTSVLFMILSNALLLSRKYSDAFMFVEETNQNLERIVDERTHNLKVTNDAMKDLVSDISHDLKTPLAVMSLKS
ncbi:MAG: hypothetical protein LBS19_16970 [Clostridiales bacterium]|jgi:signal transduction histidine kinase|nr:hypothetical protein [Clostridiales bacterium]